MMSNLAFRSWGKLGPASCYDHDNEDNGDDGDDGDDDDGADDNANDDCDEEDYDIIIKC